MPDIDKLIKKIVMLKALAEKGYWIKSIKRPAADSFENTVVELAFGDAVVAKVVFGKLGVTIDNKELQHYESDISKVYRRELFKINPELKKDYEAKLMKVEEAVAAYRQSLIDSLNAKGRLCAARKVSLSKDNGSLSSRIFEQCHGGGLAPMVNPYNTPERELKPGEVYFADLSPALAEEVSGKRPVIILRAVGDRVNIVPLSSKTDVSAYDDDTMLISANDSGTGKDGHIILSNLMTVHKSRIYDRTGQLSDELLDEVFEQAFKFTDIHRMFHDLGELEDFSWDETDDVLPDLFSDEELEEAAKLTAVADLDFPTSVDEYIDLTRYDHDGREKFPVEIQPSKYIRVREPEKVASTARKPFRSPVEEGRVINIDELYAGHDVHFELTDEELEEIAKAYEVSRPKIVFDRRKVMHGELSLGVSVNYNKGTIGTNVYPVELRVNPFSVTVVVGGRTFKQERAATKALVEILSKKYPDIYPKVYAGQSVRYYQRYYSITHDKETAGERLAASFSYIGKKARSPEKLCEKRVAYDFDKLVGLEEEFPDTPEEELNIPSIPPQVEKHEPAVRTLVREDTAPIVIMPEEVRATKPKSKPKKQAVSYPTEIVPTIKDYTLSEDDIRRIGELKVELSNLRGSKKKFLLDSARIDDYFEGKTLRDDGDPIMLYLNEGILGDGYFHTEMGIYLFHGSFWCGDRGSNYDHDTQAAIAMVLSERYPDRYPRDYAKHYVNYYNKLFNNGKVNATQACDGLDRVLTYIGKRSAHTSDLIMSDPKYFMFEDLFDLKDEGETE